MTEREIIHAELGKVTILIKPGTRSIRARIKADAIVLSIPSPTLYNTGMRFLDENQTRLLEMKRRAALRTAVSIPDTDLRKITEQAKSELPARVDEIARKYGFSHNGVGIRNMKSRWGSCSSGKVIHLSVYLMRLPSHLIDFVIVHELCHTREMNHSSRFWHEVELIYHNYRELNKELRNHHIV